MKRVIWLVAIAMAAQAIAEAQTQVLSRNAVGYVKITAERGKLVLGRSDFYAVGTAGGIAVSNLFGEQLPGSTIVSIWDRVNSTYKTVTKGVRGGWGAGGSNIVYPGDAFWIKVPHTASNEAYDVFLMGEVPDRFSAPTTTISGIHGLAMLGYPYPVSVFWTNTTLAQQLPGGSILNVWDQSNQVYVPYTKSIRGQWPASASNLVIHPGQGFWVMCTSTVNWIEAKPYTWP